MAENSWDNSAPSPSRRRSWAWLWKGALVLVASVAGLVLLLLVKAQTSSRKVWPLMRQVAERLRTDEGAKDLWNKNPVLKQSYGGEAAFLEEVRVHRLALAALPVMEPPRDGKEFKPSAGPFNVSLRFHAGRDTWIQLVIQNISFSRDRNLGEGITQLVFGKDEESLKSRQREARQAFWVQEWNQFRNIGEALRQDDSTRMMYRQHVGLKAQFPDEGAFLSTIQGWRSHLKPLPEDYETAKATWNRQRRSTPFGNSLKMTYPVDTGFLLHQNWRDGELVEIRLEAVSR